MGKRVFSREFKLEAVKLVKERGVSRSHAALDLGIHVNVLRKLGSRLQRGCEPGVSRSGEGAT
jgi:transposase-like protein